MDHKGEGGLDGETFFPSVIEGGVLEDSIVASTSADNSSEGRLSNVDAVCFDTSDTDEHVAGETESTMSTSALFNLTFLITL